MRIPLFFRTAVPRVQNGEADFAVVVKVRVETNRVPSSRRQMDLTLKIFEEVDSFI